MGDRVDDKVPGEGRSPVQRGSVVVPTQFTQMESSNYSQCQLKKDSAPVVNGRRRILNGGQTKIVIISRSSKHNALATTNIRDKNVSNLGSASLRSGWVQSQNRPWWGTRHTNPNGGGDRHGHIANHRSPITTGCSTVHLQTQTDEKIR